ncbi:hypothetical protein G6F63_014133 [Rhizopus arrhizus]|nr:hypothetical protein G6F63_014133 [Rhizopus arrhizus]
MACPGAAGTGGRAGPAARTPRYRPRHAGAPPHPEGAQRPARGRQPHRARAGPAGGSASGAAAAARQPHLPGHLRTGHGQRQRPAGDQADALPVPAAGHASTQRRALPRHLHCTARQPGRLLARRIRAAPWGRGRAGVL